MEGIASGNDTGEDKHVEMCVCKRGRGVYREGGGKKGRKREVGKRVERQKAIYTKILGLYVYTSI